VGPRDQGHRPSIYISTVSCNDIIEKKLSIELVRRGDSYAPSAEPAIPCLSRLRRSPAGHGCYKQLAGGVISGQ